MWLRLWNEKKSDVGKRWKWSMHVAWIGSQLLNVVIHVVGCSFGWVFGLCQRMSVVSTSIYRYVFLIIV